MSNNLDLSQVASNQNQKETTINDQAAELDAALTESLSVDVTSASQVVSDANYRRNQRFFVTGATTTGRTVTVAQIKRLIFVEADSTNTESFDLVRGTAAFTMEPGTSGLYYTDGTANGLFPIGAGGLLNVSSDGLELGVGGPATLAALTVYGDGAEGIRIVNTSTGSPFCSFYEGTSNRRAFIEYQVGANTLRVNAEESGSDLALMAANAEVLRLNADKSINHDGGLLVTAAGHIQLTSYTVAGLPSVDTGPSMIFVSDESGGAVPAFSDGANWLRITDRAVVS